MDVSGQGFRPIRGEFATYWRQGKIAREVEAHICRCWFIRDAEDLAAYLTLLAHKLTVEESLLHGEGVLYKIFPAVKIGFLAADRRARGAGKFLVEWAMDYISTILSPAVGLRFLTVDVLYDADNQYDSSGFYLKLGFQFANPEEEIPPKEGYRTLFFDLKPLIDAIAE
jgi:GNAT superfamily N-acetyltransferase